MSLPARCRSPHMSVALSSVQRILLLLSHITAPLLSHITAPSGRGKYYHPHFLHEETETKEAKSLAQWQSSEKRKPGPPLALPLCGWMCFSCIPLFLSKSHRHKRAHGSHFLLFPPRATVLSNLGRARELVSCSAAAWAGQWKAPGTHPQPVLVSWPSPDKAVSMWEPLVFPTQALHKSREQQRDKVTQKSWSSCSENGGSSY